MSFEVQSLRQGKWIIEAILDEKDEAIFDAQRLSELRAAVRVIEETFIPENETFRTKVIYRRERDISAIEDEKEKKPADDVPEHAALESELGLYEGMWRGIKAFFGRLGVSIQRFMGSAYFIAIKFILIAGFGLWLLYILQKLATKF